MMMRPKRRFALNGLNLARLFFFLLVCRNAFTLLFFRDNPALGPVANAALSIFCLAIALTVLLGKGAQYRLKWPISMLMVASFFAWSACSLVWTQGSSRGSAAGFVGLAVLDIITALTILRVS